MLSDEGLHPLEVHYDHVIKVQVLLDELVEETRVFWEDAERLRIPDDFAYHVVQLWSSEKVRARKREANERLRKRHPEEVALFDRWRFHANDYWQSVEAARDHLANSGLDFGDRHVPVAQQAAVRADRTLRGALMCFPMAMAQWPPMQQQLAQSVAPIRAELDEWIEVMKSLVALRVHGAAPAIAQLHVSSDGHGSASLASPDGRALASRLLEVIQDLPKVWIATDKELVALMAAGCEPSTSGFEELGRLARKPLDRKIAAINTCVNDLLPFVDSVVRQQLLAFSDLLALDRYVQNPFGEMSDRWRQTWSMTAIEPHMIAVSRMLRALVLAPTPGEVAGSVAGTAKIDALIGLLERRVAEVIPGVPESEAPTAAAAGGTQVRPSRREYFDHIAAALVKIAQVDSAAFLTWRVLLQWHPLPSGLSEESFKTYWTSVRQHLLTCSDPLLEISKKSTALGTAPACLRSSAMENLAARLKANLEELLKRKSR